MKKRTVVLVVMLLLIVGCSQIKYDGVEMLRIGDVETKGIYSEKIIGPAEITVDPATGLHNYVLEPNSTYIRFSVDATASEGKLPIEPLAAVIAEAIKAAMTPGLEN